jgi:hypothetical protein
VVTRRQSGALPSVIYKDSASTDDGDYRSDRDTDNPSATDSGSEWEPECESNFPG